MSDTIRVQPNSTAPRLHTAQYLGATAINGPLVIIEGVQKVAYGETVEIVGAAARSTSRLCKLR